MANCAICGKPTSDHLCQTALFPYRRQPHCFGCLILQLDTWEHVVEYVAENGTDIYRYPSHIYASVRDSMKFHKKTQDDLRAALEANYTMPVPAAAADKESIESWNSH